MPPPPLRGAMRHLPILFGIVLCVISVWVRLAPPLGSSVTVGLVVQSAGTGSSTSSSSSISSSSSSSLSSSSSSVVSSSSSEGVAASSASSTSQTTQATGGASYATSGSRTLQLLQVRLQRYFGRSNHPAAPSLSAPITSVPTIPRMPGPKAVRIIPTNATHPAAPVRSIRIPAPSWFDATELFEARERKGVTGSGSLREETEPPTSQDRRPAASAFTRPVTVDANGNCAGPILQCLKRALGDDFSSFVISPLSASLAGATQELGHASEWAMLFLPLALVSILALHIARRCAATSPHGGKENKPYGHSDNQYDDL